MLWIPIALVPVDVPVVVPVEISVVVEATEGEVPDVVESVPHFKIRNVLKIWIIFRKKQQIWKKKFNKQGEQNIIFHEARFLPPYLNAVQVKKYIQKKGFVKCCSC